MSQTKPGLADELRRLVFVPSSFIDDHTTILTLTMHKRIMAALRSHERMREALERAQSDCQLAIDALGNSGPEFDSVKAAFGIVRDRLSTALQETDSDRDPSTGELNDTTKE